MVDHPVATCIEAASAMSNYIYVRFDCRTSDRISSISPVVSADIV